MERGRWPDSLGELVPELLKAVPRDAYGDGGVCYRRTEGGAVVYSVGPDGKDNGRMPLDVDHERTSLGLPAGRRLRRSAC